MRSTLIDINIFYIFSIIFIDINSWGQWCVLRCQWFSLRSSIVCLALHQLDGTLHRHHLHNQHCHHRHHCQRHQRNLWYWFTIYSIYRYINTIIDAIIMCSSSSSPWHQYQCHESPHRYHCMMVTVQIFKARNNPLWRHKSGEIFIRLGSSFYAFFCCLVKDTSPWKIHQRL